MNTIYKNSEAYRAQFLKDSQYINQIFQDERKRLFFLGEETAVSRALLFIFPKQGNRMVLVLLHLKQCCRLAIRCNLCSTSFYWIRPDFFPHISIKKHFHTTKVHRPVITKTVLEKKVLVPLGHTCMRDSHLIFIT